MLAGLALVLSVASGWFVARLILARQVLGSWWQKFFIEGAISVGIGASLTSLLYFLLLVAGIATPWSSLLFLVLLSATLGYLVARRSSAASRPNEPRAAISPWMWVVRLAFLSVIVLVAVEMVGAYAAEPHGWWDAFSIWNLRARFLASGGPGWSGAFSEDLNAGFMGASHPGYPLLLPGWIACVWMASGSTVAWVPAAVGALFCFATLFLLAGAVGTMQGELAGLLAALVLAASSSFVAQSAWQIADVPLGFFLLGGTAMVALAQRGSNGAALLAGLLAGFAPWAKNEGWPFLLTLVPVAFWLAGRRTGLLVTLGALPGVATTLLFKLVAVRGTEAAFPQSAAEILARLSDPARWATVASSFARAFMAMGPLWGHPIVLLTVLAFAFRMTPKHIRILPLAIPAVAVLVSSFAVLLVTRADLAWQTGTSVHRLVLQSWPALLFAVFMTLRPPARASRCQFRHSRAG